MKNKSKAQESAYLTPQELDLLDKLLKKDATIEGWVANRIKGVSSSMAFTSPTSLELVKKLDKLMLPLIKLNQINY